jgi:hypothetical protein
MFAFQLVFHLLLSKCEPSFIWNHLFIIITLLIIIMWNLAYS